MEPIHWMHSIESPVFVFEGTTQSNLGSLQAMARVSTNPLIHFLAVRGATHFGTLTPMKRLIAAKVLRDDAPTTSLGITKRRPTVTITS